MPVMEEPARKPIPGCRRKRAPQVRANPCAKCGSDDTIVETTREVVRYCKCRFCGHTWKQIPRG